MNKPPYTEKQGQYLAFIHLYTKLHREPPAQTDMQRYFGVTPPSVHGMVKQLEKNGLISRVPRTPRSLRVLLPPDQLPELK
jgi:Mn-dependent DtxR family transcriptional regulator